MSSPLGQEKGPLSGASLAASRFRGNQTHRVGGRSGRGGATPTPARRRNNCRRAPEPRAGGPRGPWEPWPWAGSLPPSQWRESGSRPASRAGSPPQPAASTSAVCGTQWRAAWRRACAPWRPAGRSCSG